MRLRIAALLVVGLALGPLACAHREAGHDLGEMTLDQVGQRLHEPGFYVFDNNSQEQWESGHVPGAKWVPYDHVTAADLPADKNATLVFYCANEH